MGDTNKIEAIVERAVGEVLNSILPGLRQQIAAQVLGSLQPQLQSSGGKTPDSADLNEAMAAIQSGTTQVQILDALVDGGSRFVARTALYVVRGANAVGWRARGFDDDDAVRNTPLELTTGLPAQALDCRHPVSGPTADFVNGFADRFGAATADALVCPLIVRDKVVAVVYADSGINGERFDASAVEALVRVAGLWLEVFATRKVAAPLHESAHAIERPQPKAAAASAAVASAPAVATPAPVAVEPQPAPPSVSIAAPENDEVHKKARRFAKLLVDEIKLYNQAKVAEGRQNRDLYDRLKEDIEKSRASYDKRYGESAAKDSDYFNQELVRILADNDPSLLGGNFPR